MYNKLNIIFIQMVEIELSKHIFLNAVNQAKKNTKLTDFKIMQCTQYYFSANKFQFEI